jgi:hypothetical protein
VKLYLHSLHMSSWNGQRWLRLLPLWFCFTDEYSSDVMLIDKYSTAKITYWKEWKIMLLTKLISTAGMADNVILRILYVVLEKC